MRMYTFIFKKANKFLLFYINYQEINIYFKKQSHFKEVIPSFDWKGKEKRKCIYLHLISSRNKRHFTE